jgi:hypothetical protein
MPLGKAVPSLDETGLDLLKGMLIYDPAGRVSGEYSLPPHTCVPILFAYIGSL